MITREEAQQLVLVRLHDRQVGQDVSIAEDRTIERAFGWVFFVSITGTAQHQPIIVNKHVAQIIGSTTEYPPERLIEIYEELLATNRGNETEWCLTFRFPFPRRDRNLQRLADKARTGGLYEIR